MNSEELFIALLQVCFVFPVLLQNIRSRSSKFGGFFKKGKEITWNRSHIWFGSLLDILWKRKAWAC
jgi:hypothetical protein